MTLLCLMKEWFFKSSLDGHFWELENLSMRDKLCKRCTWTMRSQKLETDSKCKVLFTLVFMLDHWFLTSPLGRCCHLERNSERVSLFTFQCLLGNLCWNRLKMCGLNHSNSGTHSLFLPSVHSAQLSYLFFCQTRKQKKAILVFVLCVYEALLTSSIPSIALGAWGEDCF